MLASRSSMIFQQSIGNVNDPQKLETYCEKRKKHGCAKVSAEAVICRSPQQVFSRAAMAPPIPALRAPPPKVHLQIVLSSRCGRTNSGWGCSSWQSQHGISTGGTSNMEIHRDQPTKKPWKSTVVHTLRAPCHHSTAAQNPSGSRTLTRE